LKRGISALLLLALLALPAAALAAPVNDKFANRQVLPAGFPGGEPIEVTGSNVDAGDEGEFLPGLSPAGHSVWFGWEATGDGWVTVGACDSEFRTLIGVFTGTEVEDLTLVASGNGSEGPDCPYEGGRQYTFFATAGTEYVIAVDGNNFHLPEAPTPVTEGEFELEIKETPVPPNDEFENATEITGSISEEPGGDRRFSANARGFNWTASIEHGEPDELISGASVWYSFTAPEEATYSFGQPCCQTASFLRRDLYIGDAVDELTPLLVGSKTAEVHLTAGATVRIRVSGPIEEGSEEPGVANFDFNVNAILAGRDTETPNSFESWSPPPPAVDITPPRTAITKTVLKRQPPILLFKFGSDEPGSSFRCSLDGGRFRPCGSGKRFARQAAGLHKLRVVAVDPAGNVDPTPAVGRFRFPPPRRLIRARG
jgi:hypothetical protein